MQTFSFAVKFLKGKHHLEDMEKHKQTKSGGAAEKCLVDLFAVAPPCKRMKKAEATTDKRAAAAAVKGPKRYRRTLISTMEFDRLVQKPAVKWSTLTPATIYKLVWVYGGDKGKVVGNLEDCTGNIISTLLPRFVVDRLLRISNEPGTNTFIRPMGGEEVDIAVAKKLVCKKCEKELSSPEHLDRHMEKCGRKNKKQGGRSTESGSRESTAAIQCTQCGRRFKTLSRLRRHENRETPCRPPTHYCSRCGKGFVSGHSLWNHRQRCQAASESVDPMCI